MDEFINQLAEQQLGPAQQPAPQEAPAPAPQQGQEQPAPPPSNEKESPTLAEKVAEKTGEPEQSAVQVFELEVGGQKRQFTDKQLRGTVERYTALNSRWQNEVAPAQPIIEYANKLMARAKESGIDCTMEQIVEYIDAAARAFQHNATMGQQQPQVQAPPQAQAQPSLGMAQQDGSAIDEDTMWEQWEQENAISLPPQLKAAAKRTGQLEQALVETQQMMSQLLGMIGGQGTAATEQAAQVNGEAQAMQANTVQRQIGMNLNRVQQMLALPDEAEQDFMRFAYDRGYTLEDFLDPQLTLNVATDFKNAMNSGELDRLRGIAQRRQAFTGSVQGAPVNNMVAAPTGGDPLFSSMVSDAYAKRNMM